MNGDAVLPQFGAWTVKQVTNKGVVFEATQDAEVTQSFSGFSINAPNTITGLVFWLTLEDDLGTDGTTLGPVGDQE